MQKLKVLFIPIDAVGHTNAAIGMAQVLMGAGHEVLFITSKLWSGRLEKYGIEEVIISNDNQEVSDPAVHWANWLLNVGMIGGKSSLRSATIRETVYRRKVIEGKIKMDEVLDELLLQIKPDVIMVDQLTCISSVEKSGIPWVLVCSCNPLYVVEDERTPPGSSGLL